MAPLMLALFCLLGATQSAVIVPSSAAAVPTQDATSLVVPLTILATDDGVKDAVADVKDKVADAVSDVKDKVSDIVDDVKDKVADIVDAAQDKASAAVDIADTASAVADTVSDVVDGIQDAISATNDDAGEAMASAIEDVQEAISEAADDAKEQISEVLDEVADSNDESISDDVTTDKDGDDDSNNDDTAEIDDRESQDGDDTKDGDNDSRVGDDTSVVLDFVESLKRDLGLVTSDDDNSMEGHESAEDRTDDRDIEIESRESVEDDADDLFEALFPSYVVDDDNSRDGDDDGRRLNRYVTKMSKVKGYLDTLEANLAHSKALQAGTCPMYPVQVDTDKVTITTQNGCKMIIRLKGAVVDRIETGHENLTDRKGLKRSVEISYLDH